MRSKIIILKIINLFIDFGGLLLVMLYLKIPFFLSSVFLITALFVLFILKLYTTRFQSYFKDIVIIIVGIVSASSLTITFNFLFININLSIYQSLNILIISVVSLIILHLLFKIIEVLLIRFKKWQFRIIIFGFSQSAKRLIENFKVQNAIQVVGIVDNVIKKGTEINGVKVLGKLSEIEKIIKDEKIDQIFQASQTEQTINLLNIAWKNKVELKILPNLLGVYRDKIEGEEIFGISLLRISPTAIIGWRGLIKRFFDILAATIILLLFTPLLIVNFLRLKIIKPEKSAILGQKRFNGFEQKEFELFHFWDADILKPNLISKNYHKNTHMLLKIRNHHKKPLSRFWRILAQTPELYNVFLGDISLIGPRPPYKIEAQNYQNFYLKRFIIKPGLISPATLTGQNQSFESMIEAEYLYIEKWSILLDMKLLFLSFAYLVKRILA